MGNLLKVLTIVILILSIGALTLALMLFGKREVLKGRAEKLENAVVAIANTIEAGEPETVMTPDFPSRDVSPVTSEIIENPERDDFWKEYAIELEQKDLPTMNLAQRRVELRSFYKVDPITQKPVKDATGSRITEGEGTMQAVLNDVLTKAAEQRGRLNETRRQLQEVRKELVDTIEALNSCKSDARIALNTAEKKEDLVAEAESKLAPLQDQISQLEQEKRELQNSANDAARRVTLLQEQIQDKDSEIRGLKNQIAEGFAQVRDKEEKDDGEDTEGSQAQTLISVVERPVNLNPGIKGSVASVNADWNFVVVQLSDRFVKELYSKMDDGVMPMVDLMVRRSDDPDAFVTKVRLVQVNSARKLAVADVLNDWQQRPLKTGDEVFF